MLQRACGSSLAKRCEAERFSSRNARIRRTRARCAGARSVSTIVAIAESPLSEVSEIEAREAREYEESGEPENANVLGQGRSLQVCEVDRHALVQQVSSVVAVGIGLSGQDRRLVSRVDEGGRARHAGPHREDATLRRAQQTRVLRRLGS